MMIVISTLHNYVSITYYTYVSYLEASSWVKGEVKIVVINEILKHYPQYTYVNAFINLHFIAMTHNDQS